MDDTQLIAPNLRWLIRDSSEFQRAWSQLLATDFGPPAKSYHPCGEQWMYIGTYRPSETANRWTHHFRHYYHPSTCKQENVYIISIDNETSNYICY